MTELPTWEGFMVPVLRVLEHGEEMTAREIRNAASDLVGLSQEQRTDMLPRVG